MSDEQQIRDLIATWLRASAEGDINKILPLMTEDVVFLIAGHRRCAVVERSQIRGPAIIGAGTRVINSFVGPFTAIDEDCQILFSEVEHSVILARTRVDHAGRLEDSLVPSSSGPTGGHAASGLPAREVRFERVSFSYPASERAVFDELTLVLPAGRSPAPLRPSPFYQGLLEAVERDLRYHRLPNPVAPVYPSCPETPTRRRMCSARSAGIRRGSLIPRGSPQKADRPQIGLLHRIFNIFLVFHQTIRGGRRIWSWDAYIYHVKPAGSQPLEARVALAAEKGAMAARFDRATRLEAYRALAPFAAFDAAVRPIFLAHTIKMTEALYRMEIEDGREGGGAYLDALVRFLATEVPERSFGKTANVAKQFLEDGRPPVGLY